MRARAIWGIVVLVAAAPSAVWSQIDERFKTVASRAGMAIGVLAVLGIVLAVDAALDRRSAVARRAFALAARGFAVLQGLTIVVFAATFASPDWPAFRRIAPALAPLAEMIFSSPLVVGWPAYALFERMLPSDGAGVLMFASALALTLTVACAWMLVLAIVAGVGLAVRRFVAKRSRRLACSA